MRFLSGNPTDNCWAQDEGLNKDLHPVTGEFAYMRSSTLNAGLTDSYGNRLLREIDHKEIPSGGAILREESEEYKEGALNSQSSGPRISSLYGLFIRSGGLLDVCRFSVSPDLLLGAASQASAEIPGP